MGHLNGILARVGGNLNDNFQKSQMPGGVPGGGMLKLRFDRYIMPGAFTIATFKFFIQVSIYKTIGWQRAFTLFCFMFVVYVCI